MDFRGKQDVPNPREKANPLSKLFFLWILPLFCKGAKKDLGIDDMYNAPKEDSAAQLGIRLGKAWDDHLQSAKKKKTKPKFYNALWSVFGGRFTLFGLGTLFDECVIRVAQPIFLRLLIKSFSDHSVSSSDRMLYAAGVCLTSLVHALLMHPISFGILHLGMKCRISTSSLIYRKTLRLSKAAQEQTPIGQIINLLGNDVARFDFNVLFLSYLFIGPLQTVIFTYFLWHELGISCLAGTGFVMLLMPLQYYIGKLSRRFRFRLATKTDERGRIMNEIIMAMRVIKIYAWELPFRSIIQNVRREEVKALRKRAYLRSFYFSMNAASSKLVPYMTFFIYVMLGNQLTADKVFFALPIFNIVITNMVSTLPSAAAGIGELIVATNRIENFLQVEEQTLSSGVEVRHSQESQNLISEGKIVPSIHMENVTARWTNNTRNNDLTEVTTKGLTGHKLIMVVGPIGSGKTSFLQALLQELPISSGKCLITGRVGFACQEPWMFSGTLRQNILFGRPYNENKYQSIVSACALESDFQQLPFGDLTEVGERGITMSGGQKARVGLARALYQEADIYLLDDPLSAVDSRVSRHIFDKCLKRYLSKTLRILVTHQLQYLPQADNILVFKDGRLLDQGTFTELLDKGTDFVNIITSETEESVSFRRQSLTKLEETEKEVKKDEETRASNVEKMTSGAVSWRTYWKYFRLGNSYISMFAVLFGFVLSQLLYSSTDWWLQFWTNCEEEFSKTLKPAYYASVPGNYSHNAWNSFENKSVTRSPSSAFAYTAAVNQTFKGQSSSSSYTNIFAMFFGNSLHRDRGFYIGIYFIFVILVALTTNLKAVYFFRYCMRISINIHDKMFSSLIRAPIKFYDENPSGRIMNRFTKDLSSMDENLPAAFIDVIEIFLVMIGVIVIVVMSNVYIIVPSLLFIISLWYLRGFYIKTARDVKRVEAITKSPLFTHLTASVQGLTTIRCSKRQNVLIQQFDYLQDIHSSAWFLFISSNRWFGIWLEMISILYLACVTFSFLVFGVSKMSGIGLAISSVLTLTGTFQWGMRQSAETENLMTSVERTIEYTKIKPEAPLESDPESKPPKGWPSNGNIQFSNVSLTYDNKPVLDNLSFEIKARERIGIVGRTGAGKSSILSALFRLTEPIGEIYIDGVKINDVGLHDLRKNLSIIPQDPLLFSNTVRYNLDPFNQFEDNELWEVLEEVNLKEIVPALDWEVIGGGTNFSIGQRQLVCLARAILRKNRIIVMDEATANVDPRTDDFIQSTIRKKFSDCTILMIAHRLHSVMDCDRILVMENGHLKEYDHPHILMKNQYGILFSMSKHTGRASHEQLKQTAHKAYLKKYGPPIDSNTIPSSTMGVANVLPDIISNEIIQTDDNVNLTNNNINNNNSSPEDDDEFLQPPSEHSMLLSNNNNYNNV